jgi:hypothetical protein
MSWKASPLKKNQDIENHPTNKLPKNPKKPLNL